MSQRIHIPSVQVVVDDDTGLLVDLQAVRAFAGLYVSVMANIQIFVNAAAFVDR